jgi:ABC-2 type transport system ATP-binding protein
VNGAGKTTTFGLISGYLPGETGSININGKLSILPQDAQFYPDRSAGSQLKLFGLLSGIPRNRVNSEIDRVLELVGLEDCKKIKAEKLSHGMTKRLAIAQSLLGDPDILLLDEPTSGLDPRNVYEVRQLIISLGQNKTLVISSHILSEIDEICKTVGILHKGRMCFEGPIQEITRSESRVTYHISSAVDPAVFAHIPEITDLVYDPGQRTLCCCFNGTETGIESINKKIIKILTAGDIGIREIHQGHTLEEGFLNLLK